MIKQVLAALALLAMAAHPLAALAWDEAEVVSANAGRSGDSPDYVVQAAAFAGEAEAWSLAEELAAQGLTPYIFAGPGSDGVFRYGVRLGVYESLYDALQAVQGFSRDNGLNAEITADGSVEPINWEREVFAVQVAALSRRENVQAQVAEYEAKGYAAGAFTLHDRGEPWHIVHVGGYATFEAADQAAADFRRQENQPCYVLLLDRALFEHGVADR